MTRLWKRAGQAPPAKPSCNSGTRRDVQVIFGVLFSLPDLKPTKTIVTRILATIPAADPASVVRFLIEQQNLTQRDLIPQFGSESAVSMFLGGQRNLTIEQVRRLSTRFKLPTDVFIPKGAVRAAR